MLVREILILGVDGHHLIMQTDILERDYGIVQRPSAALEIGQREAARRYWVGEEGLDVSCSCWLESSPLR